MKQVHNKTLIMQIFVLLLLILILAGCSNVQSSANEPIVLRVVTAWEENNINSAAYPLFKEKVEAKSNGQVKIEYLGGPEAIPAFNQGDAVRNGSADISIVSTAYITSIFPESNVIAFTQLTPQEERESGALDYLNKHAAEKMNAIILGHATDMGFSLYLKKPISSPDEIKGLRIRAAPVYIPFLKELGAEIISMPPGEMYTALERGVIDGVAWPEAGITDFGLEKQLGAKIAPSYNQVDTVAIMNLKKYEQLPEDVKSLLTEVMIEVENEVGAIVEEYIKKEEEKLKQENVAVVTMTDKRYAEAAVNASWKWVTENIQDGDQLQKFFRKQ